MAIRYSTLVKLYGEPVSPTKLSNAELQLAHDDGRILTIFDSGPAFLGGWRRVDVFERKVFMKLSEKHRDEKVIGVK